MTAKACSGSGLHIGQKRDTKVQGYDGICAKVGAVLGKVFGERF